MIIPSSFHHEVGGNPDGKGPPIETITFRVRMEMGHLKEKCNHNLRMERL